MNKIIKYRNVDIHYQLEGEGDCLILLHGFIENKSIWDYQVNLLKNSLKVITIDIPGHGKSASYSDSHEMNEVAELTKIIMDVENVEKAVVAGHSMGGYIAVTFAGLYPERTKGLVFFHSHALEDNEETKKNRMRTIEIVERNKTGFITNFIPDLFADENVEKYKELIDELKSSASMMSEQAVCAALRGMKNRKSGLETLIKAKHPVLFILGKEDKRINYANTLAQASMPSHSEMLILDHVGHMGWVEAREKTTSAIQSFTRRCYE
jgi:pimeloyl-ACP methyl ester carboxylesterase